MNAFPVANHILWRANKDAVDITPMKLQKIIYFLHGWYMAITGQKLIDEGFARWQYGPVVPSLYRELKHYGSLPIDDYIKQYNPSSGTFVPFFVNTELMPRFNDILEQVWNKYGSYNAIQLSSMTHLPGTPWAVTPSNEDIDDDLIQEYFVSQAFQNQLQQHG